MQYLPFEQPIAELAEKIRSLKEMVSLESEEVSLAEDIHKLEEKQAKLTRTIFAKLSPWKRVQVARHPDRPHTEEYIAHVFTDFTELHGDRNFKDDAAIIAGLARLRGTPVMVIGHRKGRETADKIACNFGMPRPEGYRKAKRLMELAARMKLPIVTFVDTPGAYPGIDAEKRGQSEAIATNLAVMSQLPTPIITLVIGEGGSGGALAISVADSILMLEYAIYSVISPEGCASILWKDAQKAEKAADILKLTAPELLHYGIVDRVLEEPLGSACRDHETTAHTIENALCEELELLKQYSADDIIKRRYQRLKQHTTLAFMAAS